MSNPVDNSDSEYIEVCDNCDEEECKCEEECDGCGTPLSSCICNTDKVVYEN